MSAFERLVTPSKWTGDEQKFAIRLKDCIEELYRKLAKAGKSGGECHMPAGGTQGQVLGKKSDSDYDTDWVVPVGEKGEKGEKGDRGEPGVPGEKGEKGEKGESGSLSAYIAVFPASGWSASAPYIQAVAVPGLVAEKRAFVDIDMSLADESSYQSYRAAWALVDVAETGSDTLRLTCYGGVPQVDLTVLITA